MSHLPPAVVTILKQPCLHPDAIRVEIECRYLMTGLTQVPGLMQALTWEQMITAAVFEHEARCGACDTEPAHERGDRRVREMTDRAWESCWSPLSSATTRAGGTDERPGRASRQRRPVGELAARLGSVRDRQRRGEPPRVGRAPRPSPPRLRRTPAPKWKRR